MIGWAWRGVLVQMWIVTSLTVAICLAFVYHYDSAVTNIIIIMGAVASQAFAKARSQVNDPGDPSGGTSIVPPSYRQKAPPVVDTPNLKTTVVGMIGMIGILLIINQIVGGK